MIKEYVGTTLQGSKNTMQFFDPRTMKLSNSELKIKVEDNN